MFVNRRLLLSLWLGWVALAIHAATAYGQPMAMPATVLSTEPPPRGTPIAPEAWAPSPRLAQAAAVVVSPSPTIVPLAPSVVPPAVVWTGPWTWQVVPEGLMYPAYLAGGRESRFASEWGYEKDVGWLWDVTLGGRVGVLRYGTQDPLLPEGFQIDIEGAAFPRLDMHENLISSDFRFGMPLTARQGPWEGKFGFYHLSSHLADEFLLSHPKTARINYSRDVLVLGAAFRPIPDIRLYTEAGWAFHTDGGSRPWEFQFGADFSPIRPSGWRGSPFIALNGQIREEVDYGGSFTAQAGWQWRGQAGHLARVGAEYFDGKSDQFQFFRTHEQRIGVGLWYDY